MLAETTLTPLPRPLQVGDKMRADYGTVYTVTSIVSHNWAGTGFTLAEFTWIDDEGNTRIDGGYAERYRLIDGEGK